jgi:hypothetical protein
LAPGADLASAPFVGLVAAASSVLFELSVGSSVVFERLRGDFQPSRRVWTNPGRLELDPSSAMPPILVRARDQTFHTIASPLRDRHEQKESARCPKQ